MNKLPELATEEDLRKWLNGNSIDKLATLAVKLGIQL